jgi:hypothetical protein
MPDTTQSYDDPTYKNEMEKLQLNWLIYAVMDKDFRDILFQNPPLISTQLGLDHKLASALENLVHRYRIDFEKIFDELSRIFICDNWPCPPIQKKILKM